MLVEKIIAEAHSWLGTKFKHQGRIKKTDNDSGLFIHTGGWLFVHE